MSGRLGNDMEMPFEEDPAGGFQIDLSDAQIAGGAVVMAAVVPTLMGPKPSLVFRFAAPDGTFYPPVALVCDDDQLAGFKSLVFRSVNTAIQKARAAS